MNLAKYDLNLLVTLEALLTHRNVTKVARLLEVSQPTVSASLARLRTMFNDELLVRVGRDFKLTALGMQLIDPVQSAIREVESVLGCHRGFDPATEERVFRIAARDYVSFLLLPPLVERLQREAPNIRVCFSHFDCDSMRLLDHNEIDFVIMPSNYGPYLSPKGQDLPFPNERLLSTPYVCAVWSGNTEVGETLTTEQYLGMSHLIFLPGPSHRIVPRVPVTRADRKRRASVATESFLLMPFLLQGTQLVALMQEQVARKLQEAADIRLLAPPHSPPPAEQSVFWNPARERDAGLQWLKSHLVDVAASV